MAAAAMDILDTDPQVDKVPPAIALVDRRELPLADGAVYCGHCWEPVAFHPNEPHYLTARGVSSRWKHVRTGASECAPVCDACHQSPGDVPLGRREFTGAHIRFIARNFLCRPCFDQFRREQPVWEYA